MNVAKAKNSAQTPACVQADNLRQMAEVVERQRLGSRQWIAYLGQSRETGHVPVELLEAAAAVEGADLSSTRLAGFLRRLADRV